jgi:hypothetical protein
MSRPKNPPTLAKLFHSAAVTDRYFRTVGEAGKSSDHAQRTLDQAFDAAMDYRPEIAAEARDEKRRLASREAAMQELADISQKYGMDKPLPKELDHFAATVEERRAQYMADWAVDPEYKAALHAFDHEVTKK